MKPPTTKENAMRRASLSSARFLFALTVAFPLVALAQVLEPLPVEVPAGASPLLTLFLQYVLPLLITPVLAGVTWLLAQVALYFKARSADSKLATIAARVTHLADVVVHEVDAVVRPKLASALSDGVLTPAEGAELKRVAMDKLKQLLSERGLAELQGVFGILLPQVETYLSGAIEKSLANMKAEAAVPALSPA